MRGAPNRPWPADTPRGESSHAPRAGGLLVGDVLATTTLTVRAPVETRLDKAFVRVVRTPTRASGRVAAERTSDERRRKGIGAPRTIWSSGPFFVVVTARNEGDTWESRHRRESSYGCRAPGRRPAPAFARRSRRCSTSCSTGIPSSLKAPSPPTSRNWPRRAPISSGSPLRHVRARSMRRATRTSRSRCSRSRNR